MKRTTDEPSPESKQQVAVSAREERQRRLAAVLTENYTKWRLVQITPKLVVQLSCTDRRTQRILQTELMFMWAGGKMGYIWMKALRFFDFLARAEQRVGASVVVRMTELWWEIVSAAQMFRRLSVTETAEMRQKGIERSRTLMIGRIQEATPIEFAEALNADYAATVVSDSARLAVWLRMWVFSLLYLDALYGALLIPGGSWMLRLRPIDASASPNLHISFVVGTAGGESKEWLVPVASTGRLMPIVLPNITFTKRGGVPVTQHGIPDDSTANQENLRAQLFSLERGQDVSQFGHRDHVVQQDIASLALVVIRRLIERRERPAQGIIDMLLYMLPPERNVVKFVVAVAARPSWQAQAGAQLLALIQSLQTPGAGWHKAVETAIETIDRTKLWPLHPNYYRTKVELVGVEDSVLFKGLLLRKNLPDPVPSVLYTWK